MNAMILHPTASTPVPITLVATKRPKAKRVAKPRKEPNVADLQQMCRARGIKVTTKHTKGELLAMFATGTYIVPAAYARARANRQAA